MLRSTGLQSRTRLSDWSPEGRRAQRRFHHPVCASRVSSAADTLQGLIAHKTQAHTKRATDRVRINVSGAAGPTTPAGVRRQTPLPGSRGCWGIATSVGPELDTGSRPPPSPHARGSSHRMCTWALGASSAGNPNLEGPSNPP